MYLLLISCFYLTVLAFESLICIELRRNALWFSVVLVNIKWIWASHRWALCKLLFVNGCWKPQELHGLIRVISGRMWPFNPPLLFTGRTRVFVWKWSPQTQREACASLSWKSKHKKVIILYRVLYSCDVNNIVLDGPNMESLESFAKWLNLSRWGRRSSGRLIMHAS